MFASFISAAFCVHVILDSQCVNLYFSQAHLVFLVELTVFLLFKLSSHLSHEPYEGLFYQEETSDLDKV